MRHRNGQYAILHNGTEATILRGKRAVNFATKISELTFAEQQQLMARLTGNYKRGNERTAIKHLRNQK
ncbi:hypothetical protein AB833_08075 [Chromatiales bacterium (ex Bugula neritina AB1)]|nr:hypothetical protein AB833_08075 [Chromatiales bacterium (ex Bugula neritina AB1)]